MITLTVITLSGSHYCELLQKRKGLFQKKIHAELHSSTFVSNDVLLQMIVLAFLLIFLFVNVFHKFFLCNGILNNLSALIIAL
jgi:hypothetical protein